MNLQAIQNALEHMEIAENILHRNGFVRAEEKIDEAYELVNNVLFAAIDKAHEVLAEMEKKNDKDTN